MVEGRDGGSAKIILVFLQKKGSTFYLENLKYTVRVNDRKPHAQV